MDYSGHSIHLLKPMAELDIERISAHSQQRKTAFRLITDGMSVAEWRTKVSRAGLEKVDVSFLTQCYAKDDPKLIELRPLTS